MQQLSYQDCANVGGGNPIGLIALGLAVIVAAGPIHDFVDGVLDGFSRL